MDIKVVEKAFSEKLKEGENLRFYICDTFYLDLSGCITAITEFDDSESTEIEVYAGVDDYEFCSDSIKWRDEIHREIGKIVVSAEGNILSYSA